MQKSAQIFGIASLCFSMYACEGSTGDGESPVENSPPLITSAPSASIDENISIATTVTATDDDGDALTYSLSGGVDQGLFLIASNTGVLSFISSPDFEVPTDSDTNNVYLVQVRVSDGVSPQDQLISVSVNDVSDNPNTAPTITSSANVTVPENATNVITVTANDVDDDTLTYGINSGADQARFSINPSSGALSFNMAPDYEMPTDSNTNNSYLVQVFVNDGQSTTNQLIIVNVNNQNDNAPVFTSPANLSVNENTTAVVTVNATDADGNSLTYGINSGVDQALFSIDANSGALSFNTAPDYEVPTDSNANNSYLVQVFVNDGLSTTNQLITVNVNNQNDNAPLFTSPASVSVNENTTTVITVSATDADNNTLNYTVNGGADQARFTINASSGALDFIVSPDFEVPTDSDTNNVYLVQVRVSDGVSPQDQLISVSVNDVADNPNTAPTITSVANVTLQENVTNVLTVTANDVDADTLTFGINSGADQALFSINTSSGALSFNTAPDYEMPTDSNTNNSYLVQVFVSDGQSTTNQLITVNVENQNDNAPEFTSPASVSVNENTTAVITVNATDADNNTLNYTLNGGADQARFTINASSGALSFAVPPDFEAPVDSGANNVYEVQVNVGDGANAVNQMMTVTVNDLNEQISGLPSRPANSTCEIADAPVLSSSIQLTRVFNSLSFGLPTVLLQSPVNTDRWYVAEQFSGQIKTFLSGDSATTTFADLSSLLASDAFRNEAGLLGVAFHPNYAINKYVFVYYSATKISGGAAVDHQSVIARFTATSDTSLNLTSRLEIMRIDQPYENHNGGNMVFGNDGYLYIGMGDGGSGGDPDNYAQNNSSLLGKMLRIDVDNPANGNNYSSPGDNPYVGVSGLDEIYATGLRNPWRWSFDRLNGNLMLGDVGQSNREEIDIITNGGNYGWRCYEGFASFNTAGCAPQNTYVDPIYDYGRGVGQSITGGFVYRGSAIPALYGSYIYTDFYPGPIWTLSDPTGASPVNASLISTNFQISSFAEDANGEIYVVGFNNGQIYRIDPATGGGTGNFPDLLSETGCIDGATPLQMAAGLVPYEINAPFWSDGVVKDRWMALPDGATITIEADNDWTFPVNSVLVKNFNLNGTRIETRLLVRHADGDWGGYSYEWNDEETDANLLLNGKITVKGAQTYIYPSSSDCFKCHTTVTNIVLGPETGQLNRDHTYVSTGITANQLATLETIGYFSSALGDVPANLPRLTDPTDTGASLHDRARAYLHTNCSQCHRAGGPTIAGMDFNITTADVDMDACNVNPIYPIGTASSIMTPANAMDSTMYRRMICRDDVNGCDPVDKMPPLGSVLVDPGTQVVADWINSLSVCP